ncbi:hypothetical protein [Stutzerimonas nitrititolerans]|uniref:hypothetical protein n=1 Tax=Stutzerimonas nitrititolerans TaxID=2482751 RepID=UPI0028A9C21F|nr:hypothetical protein [Stutzerimonas nitrititolerans]
MQNTDKALSDFNAWWDRQPHREQFEDVKDQMRNVWVASRRELMIELPYDSDSLNREHPYVAGRRNTIAECRDAIEATGVTVRG